MPWLKRLAARLFGHGLTRLRAQHRFSWLHGQADGFRSGHEAGVEYGYREGKADGLEEGRQVLLIRDFRPDEHRAPGVDDTLFDDWRLPLTAELKKRIKADVARLLPAHAQPSAAQWKMIFSDTPSTSVIAGAGAGKSTSLVLRILLLTHYLGFELSSMTVVTFTRESRKDFINKLIEILSLWGQPLGMKEAQAVVRTFHSRILPMVRSLPGFERLQAFENLNSGVEDADGNPFDLRINEAQRQQMNACYHRLHGQHARFRELIAPLARHGLQLKALERDHPDVQKRMAVTELAAKRDEELCDAIEDLWFRAGAWPIKGIEPNRQPVGINGAQFHCHGYIRELDAWVVLGFDSRENAQISRPNAKLSLRAEWAVKRTLFQAFCRKPLIWLDSYESSRRLLSSLAGDATAGPGFDYKVKGELASAPLLDSFVMAAGFIENLGLDVPTAVGKMSFAKDDPDRFFFEALSIFWKALEDHLLDQSPPIMTYNRMFSLFGENTPENLKLLSDTLLRPLSHLMIDELGRFAANCLVDPRQPARDPQPWPGHARRAWRPAFIAAVRGGRLAVNLRLAREFAKILYGVQQRIPFTGHHPRDAGRELPQSSTHHRRGRAYCACRAGDPRQEGQGQWRAQGVGAGQGAGTGRRGIGSAVAGALPEG